MELLLIIITFVLLILTALAVYVLIRIRGSLRDIYAELNRLESKVNDKSLPEYRMAGMNNFSKKLKKILEGMKNINPGADQ